MKRVPMTDAVTIYNADHQAVNTWRVIVFDECDPVTVIVLPPPGNPEHTTQTFVDYANTYDQPQRESLLRHDLWVAGVISSRYRIGGDFIGNVYREVTDDNVYMKISQVVVTV